MAVITGYVALGYGLGLGSVFEEISGGSYAREALALTGSASAGLSQSLSSIAAATAPAGAAITYGAFFDALTNGNLLAYWQWPAPITDVGTAFPATAINVQFATDLLPAFTEGLNEQVQAGSILGTINGQPLIAGSALEITTAGNLIAEGGVGGLVIDNPVFMVNGKIVARFDASGNFILAGTVTASGAP